MTAAATMIAPAPAAIPAARTGLRIVDPTAEPGWDKLLATHPQATFFHSAPWANTLADAYGFPCRFIVATRAGELRGLLPIIEARSWLRSPRGVALPFTDECLPLITSDVSAPALLEAALQEGETRGWKYLELRGGQELFQDVPESVSFYGHTLRLPANADTAFANFDPSVQRALRKAERGGLTVEFGTDLEAVRAYYELHCRTRLKHGAPPQPFRFFQALGQRVLQPGHGFVALARQEGRPIAGAVFFQFGGEAIYKFSASDERFQEWRGANFVIGQTIRRLVADGARGLDFGRTSLTNEGLRRFKSQWGAQERIIRFIRYDFRRKSFVKIDDLAAGAQARLFALMPVVVSRWIGRAVYPHLS